MQTLLPIFKQEVTDKATEIDPDSQEDWYSLALGWAIAKGLSPSDATDFAIYVTSKTDLA